MAIIGKTLPEFTVEAYVKPTIKNISKEDVIGKWSVFFFYPADFTFVCPTELEEMQDYYEEFKERAVEVYDFCRLCLCP